MKWALAAGISVGSALFFAADTKITTPLPVIQTLVAVRAADFTDSIGVNTHSYEAPYDIAGFVTQLEFLHIGLVRDSVNQIMSGNYRLRMQEYSQNGIKFDAGIGSDPSAYQSILVKLAPYSVAFEGPNESDLEMPSYLGLHGVAAAAAMQAELYSIVKSNTLLRAVPVIDFSLGHPDRYPAYEAAINYDFLNVHAYAVAGRPPRKALQQRIEMVQKIAVYKPIIITETGYTTDQQSIFNDSKDIHGVDEITQAKYLLDTLFDDFSLGVKQTYIYDLRDDGDDPQGTNKEDHFGLFHYDRTPKISAIALHNLMLILKKDANGGCNFKPLNLTVFVKEGPENKRESEPVYSVLLGKANGGYDLVLWREPEIWDAHNHTSKSDVSEVKLVISFIGSAFTVDIYDPLSGSLPTFSAGMAQSVEIMVQDHPIIIELKKHSV